MFFLKNIIKGLSYDELCSLRMLKMHFWYINWIKTIWFNFKALPFKKAIKIPFVIEGMLIGALGSIIPIIVVIYGYVAFYDKFNGQLFSPLIKLVKPEPFIFTIAGAVLLIGILVGMFGSSRAVRKYLKV